MRVSSARRSFSTGFLLTDRIRFNKKFYKIIYKKTAFKKMPQYSPLTAKGDSKWQMKKRK
jgi:hypothetical protein